MVPILYNRTIGAAIVAVGAMLGATVGAVVGYYTSHAPTTYRGLGRGDVAFKDGVLGFAFGAVVTDLILRLRHIGRDGVGTFVSSQSGMHIWFIPVWIVGAIGGLIASYTVNG